MKHSHLLKMILAGTILALNAQAASPTIDSFNLQSYIRLTNGQPVSNTSGNFVFAVFKGTSCVWAKRYLSVALNAGMINQKISGLGTSIGSINNPNATAGECVADFTSTTLNSTLLATGASGALTIRVYSETSLDGYRPIWDVAIASAPTAFIADRANLADVATVANDVITVKKAAASAGVSDAGKLVVLDAGGKIDNTMVNTAGMTFTSSQVSGLGTAAAANTGTGSGNVPVLGGTGKLVTGVMPTYTANKILTTDGTGTITAALNSTNSSAGAGDAGKAVLLNAAGKVNNNMIDSTALTPSLANATGTLAVNKGGTGVASLNSGEILVGNGTNPVNTISSTSGNVLVGTGAGWVSSTADSAGLVDQTSTQTVGGNKTWNGNQVMNGTITLGSGGSTFSKVLQCSIASSVQTNNTEKSAACSGVTSDSVVFCSPTATPGNNWILSYARADNGNVYVRTNRTSGTATWTTAFNCVAYVP
jgi:hypothetical protein